MNDHDCDAIDDAIGEKSEERKRKLIIFLYLFIHCVDRLPTTVDTVTIRSILFIQLSRGTTPN